MKTDNTIKRNLIGALALALMTTVFPVLAGEKTEDQLIAELASSNERKVTDALLKLEKQYPTSTNAFPTMKQLLKDPREKVRRKAARVLGALHAEVDADNIKSICALLKSTTTEEVIDGLKALRGLKAQSAIPEITPLLSNTSLHPNIIRDACRTLAVLGDKDTIKVIEPLLTNPNKAIQQDAQDAIYVLKNKS